MPKTKLHIDYDYDFCLIGIVCSDKDYRLSWQLNTALHLQLGKAADHTTNNSSHSLFSYVNEEQFREYYLLANKGNGSNLIEEHRNIDYFFIIKGPLEEDEKRDMLELIKKQDTVIAAYLIDVPSLKSKQNLML